MLLHMENKEKTERAILGVLFITVLILNLILTVRHEMWCDEAQAWLLARDMGPVSIFSKVSYEGHPFLWFYILMPFAKARVPFAFIKAISFCIVMIAVWILLFSSPFPLPAKIILAFSPAVLYFYASISRSYCLIALFTVLAALLRGRRQQKPLLYGLVCALLLQTHIIMAGMVFFMCLAWLVQVLRRKDSSDGDSHDSFRKAFPGLCLPLLSALFLLWQMRGVAQADAVGAGTSGGLRYMLGTYLWALYYNVFDLMHRQKWLLGIFVFTTAGFFVTALVAGMRTEKTRFSGIRARKTAALGQTSGVTDAAAGEEMQRNAVWEALVVIVGGIAFQNVIYAFVYYPNVYRLITWLYMLIYGAWIIMEPDSVSGAAFKAADLNKRPAAAKLAGVCCTVMFLCAVMGMNLEYSPQVIRDLRGPFTYAPETAEVINSLQEDAVILENREDICNSVIPRLRNRTVWSPFSWREASYAERNRAYRHTMTVDELMEETREHFPEAEGFYLLYAVVSDNYMEIEGMEEFLADQEPVFATPGNVMSGEDYRIYYISLR